MGDEQWAPLTSSLVRTLTDKLYEKRKAAALEVEKSVKEWVGSGDWASVTGVLGVLGRLARSQNPHNRKGGLIGLAAAAIALSQKHSGDHIDLLVLPVLECFQDPDSRVRYFACESLYNICKVARESCLKHFPMLFDTLARDIVSAKKDLELADIILLIRERIHTLESRVRRFLVAWLETLLTVPGLKMVDFLPEILDGLFTILSDPQEKLQETTEVVLGQFLAALKQQNSPYLHLNDMVNVLIVHAQSSEQTVQYMGLFWLAEFLGMDGPRLLGFTSGLLTAVLPCLALGEERPKVHDVSKAINVGLLRLVSESTEEAELDLPSVLNVLSNHLSHSAVQTRVAVLKWIHHLHEKLPRAMFPLVEELFPRLLRMLSDQSDEVVLLDLEVLSSLCTGQPSEAFPSSLPPKIQEQLKDKSPYFVKLAVSLLELFRGDPGLLAERGSFILRQLSLLLSPSDIFATLAILLVEEQDLDFATVMVKSLSGMLLTATEFHGLRAALKSVESPEEVAQFRRMYQAWAHEPVALLTLCLLARRYAHAALLIRAFPDLEITTDTLVQVDKFIQLLESPIFAYLRLDLLEPQHRGHLSSVLYGLLMVLPQTEAFLSLHRRLQVLPGPFSPSTGKEKEDAATAGLLATFHATQARHLQYRRDRHRRLLANSPS